MFAFYSSGMFHMSMWTRGRESTYGHTIMMLLKYAFPNFGNMSRFQSCYSITLLNRLFEVYYITMHLRILSHCEN